VSAEPSSVARGFPRSARLLAATDYRHVFADPRRSSDRYFTVLAARRPGGLESRLGLAIAKKHVRLATGRNRIKRLVRETFRATRHSLAATDFVVLARPIAASTGNALLVKSLSRHFERLAQA
jgi:ribonuclease P protein component